MSTKRFAASPDVLIKQLGKTLHGDVLANILSYLPWTEVMKCRVVSPEWRDAALVTPVQELVVRTQKVARNLASLVTAMPCLQTLKFPVGYLLVDDEVLDFARGFHQRTSVMMSRTAFRTCSPSRILHLHNLETLDLALATSHAWDLANLSAIRRLKHLLCSGNTKLTGDLSSLKTLSETLVQLDISSCLRMTGDLHTLALFLRLESLKVHGTRVTGDVRKIASTDFPCLKVIQLGEHVYGGRTINRIVDAPEIMEAWCGFETRNAGIFQSNVGLGFGLAPGAQEQYRPQGGYVYAKLSPPFRVEVVWCGPRCGWRWTTKHQEGQCEMNWYNGAPRPDDDGYDEYVRDLAMAINGPNSVYRGLLVPPSPEEYSRMHT